MLLATIILNNTFREREILIPHLEKILSIVNSEVELTY